MSVHQEPCDAKTPCDSLGTVNFSEKALWHQPWRPKPKPFRPNKRVLRAKGNHGTSKPRP